MRRQFDPMIKSYAKQRQSLQRNGYFARNVWINIVFRVIDFVLSAVVPRYRNVGNFDSNKPIKILIANGAHLGDIVLSCATLQRLKSAYPLSTIGMLVGSWSSMVIDKHPLIDHVHIVDHWRLNRSSKSIWEKIKQYRTTRTNALSQIKAIKYDVAIDLYFFFPNSILLLFQSKVPRRIGFNSAGLGPLLTDSVNWRPGCGSIVNYFELLIDRLAAGPASQEKITSGNGEQSFLPVWPTSIKLPPSPNVVLHIGTAGASKEWPVSKWRELAEKLIADGYNLIFTGAGMNEREKIALVIKGLSNAVDLCDKLSWGEFVATIRDCDILVGVDSVAGHVAAAVGTPSITLSNGVQDPALWKPRSDLNTVLRYPVSCFPCYRFNGCEAMACIRLIRTDDVRMLINEKRATLSS